MFGGNRPDGTRVTRAPKVRLFMPYLMPRRADALVFFEQRIELSGTLDYLARWNAGPARPPLTLFHLFVAAGVRTLDQRPRLNRFVAGRRLYQRNAIDISISVIKAKADDSKLTVVKQRFDPDEGLNAIRARIEAVLVDGRSPLETPSEREVSVVSRLPRLAIPLLVKLQNVADYLNITPPSLIRNDPLYSSAMISNLGSIGLDAAYHHLYEHGTLPVFATIGKIRQEPVVTGAGTIEPRPCVIVRYSFDERVADGFYAAGAIDLLQELMEHPWLMERPEDGGPGVS